MTYPPPGFGSGLVLANKPDPDIGPVVMTYIVGHDPSGQRTRYLLCRGDACAAAAPAAEVPVY